MAKQTHILMNDDCILEIELDGSDKATAVFKRSDPNIYEERNFTVTRDAGDPLELLKDIQEQFCFADEPEFPNSGWEAPSCPDTVEVTFTNEDGHERRRKWDAFEILKDWEGEAMLCPPNETQLESATWNGKDLFVDANCCGEVGLTPGMHTFEDLMKLIRVLRDFPAELIKDLADDGMSFSIYNGKLEYLASHEFVSGVIDPADRTIKLIDERNNEVPPAPPFLETSYPVNHDARAIMNGVALACGSLDDGFNEANETLREDCFGK